MRFHGFVAGGAARRIGLRDCPRGLPRRSGQGRSELQSYALRTAKGRDRDARRSDARPIAGMSPSLTEVRKVFARCDTSASKDANAAQTGTTLAAFTRQMQGELQEVAFSPPGTARTVRSVARPRSSTMIESGRPSFQ